MQPVQFEKNIQAASIIASTYQGAPKVFMHTFGCQQNINDGELIKGVLVNLGYVVCDNQEEADFIIFNSCAVREHAEQRILGNIGALKAQKISNPKLMIAICGCMTQQTEVVEKIRKSYPYVDLVFGVNQIDLLPQMIAQRIVSKKRVFADVTQRPDIVEGMPIKRDSSFRAWLPIMFGCDNFCSYCIVPYVRGRERSRKSADILAEFKQLISEGYKDITLLGQNVNSYGKGLEEQIDFADLLKLLSSVDGDYRIRFMSSHPKDATKKLFDVIASSEHICKHIHLPVQSGSNEMLDKMNRKYTVEHYLELINYAKQHIEGVTFSSDLIVGFPGETEEDFNATANLIKEVQYAQLFTFIYSKRSGTVAAKLKDETPYKVKSERVNKLIEIQAENIAANTEKLIGGTFKVLCENVKKNGKIFGRLDNNFTVDFNGDENLIGTFVNVKITSTKGAQLKGTIVL